MGDVENVPETLLKSMTETLFAAGWRKVGEDEAVVPLVPTAAMWTAGACAIREYYSQVSGRDPVPGDYIETDAVEASVAYRAMVEASIKKQQQ